MVKEAKVKSNLGLDTLNKNVGKNEVNEKGFDYKETDTKAYAVQETTIGVPETLEEALDMLQEDAIVDAVTTALKAKTGKKMRDNMKAQLDEHIPAEVKEMIESMKETAEAGLASYDVALLEEIPFEAKTSKEALLEYVKQNK